MAHIIKEKCKKSKLYGLKEGYLTITKKCETTETCVEKVIRHTVDKIFENKNSLVEEIFGSIVNLRYVFYVERPDYIYIVWSFCCVILYLI